MAFGRGLFDLNERENRRALGGDRNSIKHLFLSDDQEFAHIRILTDVDDVFWGKFHNVQITTAKGKTFWDKKFCIEADCSLCAEKAPIQMQFMMWVYVFGLYLNQDGEGRERVKIGRSTKFKVDVNEAWILRQSAMQRGPFVTRADRDGTLVNRDYDWIRTGVRGTQKPSYSLEPHGDPYELPAELKELARSLPDLTEVAHQRAADKVGAPRSEFAPRQASPGRSPMVNDDELDF